MQLKRQIQGDYLSEFLFFNSDKNSDNHKTTLTLPTDCYNLWLNYHLQSGSTINIMTNAVGNATFYSPAFRPSPFIDIELRMLMQFYGRK